MAIRAICSGATSNPAKQSKAGQGGGRRRKRGICSASKGVRNSGIAHFHRPRPILPRAKWLRVSQ